MSDYPFSVFDLQEKDIHAFSETYKKLTTKFNAQFNDAYQLDLHDYELFNRGYEPELKEAIRLSFGSAEFYILFINVTYKIPGRTYQNIVTKEYQAWAIAEMNMDFGHVLISKETIADKVRELLQPMELNFEDDKVFSRKFYVLAQDKMKAEKSITPRFRELLLNMQEKDFLIELKGNKMLAGVTNYLNPQQTFYLAEFMTKVSSLR